MSNVLTKLIITSHTLLDIAHKLQLPANLPIPQAHDNNIEDARKILRWLRNLQNINYDMENWMRLGAAPEQQAKSDFLEKLIVIYAGQVKIAYLSNPVLLEHFTIEHANHACGSIALSTSLHTLEILPEDNKAIEILDKQLDNILPEWDSRQNQTVEQLINSIESGLSHLVNKPLGDRSPVDRLIEVSNNIQEAVRKLYELDTLGEPERIESIELAREILRRLKDLSFSDKTIEEAVDTGRPLDKLAFAQRISEMVGTYKNLLFEAMRINPDIINDARVKSANEAAMLCSGGVKIMVSREIPVDTTSLNNISADLDHVASGNDFKGASLNKLMHNMEGGVEQAAEEITAHEKRVQQEIANHETTMEMEKNRHRRRNRRHQQSASKDNDNMAQKSNNMAQHEAVVTAVKVEAMGVPNLNKMDIAAVRQAGSSLRKSNKQANDMVAGSRNDRPKAGAVVTGTGGVKPDNRGFSSKEKDNSNNPNNPRNRPRIV